MYNIISVFSACGGISILEILLSAKARLIFTIFTWGRLCLLRLLFAPCTKRRELFLLLLNKPRQFASAGAPPHCKKNDRNEMVVQLKRPDLLPGILRFFASLFAFPD
jgi:hypothetical protein